MANPEGTKKFTKQELIEGQKNFGQNGKGGDSIPLETIEAKSVQWLWPGKMPKGKVSIIAGEPDSGKSFLTLDLAARISNGQTWPDGQPCEPGKVLLMTAEDDLSDTVVPRLIGMKADRSKIKALESVSVYNPETGEKEEKSPTIIDLPTIENEIARIAPDLFVIDPVNAYLPGLDTHRDAELRAKVFSPLKQLAEKHNLAVVCVMHLNKSNSQTAKNRVSGSIAYVAASRATWLVANDQDNPERKLFIPVKFNIGKKPEGLAYSIQEYEGNLLLDWETEPIEESADEVLQPETTHSSERDVAKEFLESTLSDGAKPAKEILEEAKSFNLSERTVYRAKKNLNIKSEKKGNEWKWKLP